MIERRLVSSLFVALTAVVFAAPGCIDDPGQIQKEDVGVPDATDECPDGLTACDGQCVDTDNDPQNCGSCGVGCSQDQICIEGACQDTTEVCPDEMTDCDGQCVDTDNDPQNCGACGETCDSDEVCNQGSCELECPGDLLECGNECIDPVNDPANCGGCAGEDEGENCGDGFCVQGECEPECPSGLTECDGQCVDTVNDPDHCGGCNSDCEDGLTCFAGQCRVPVCPGDQIECDDDCVDPQTDVDHCGGCDNECEPEYDDTTAVCDQGACTEQCDDPDLTLCVGDCVDLGDNPNHCGECGIDCAAGDCNNGVCETGQNCDPDDHVTDIGNGELGDDFDGDFSDGQGPHLVCGTDHLDQIREHPDRDYLIVEDIDFEEEDSFDPIEDFSGTLRGDGFRIENLSIDSGWHVGLFADTGSEARVVDLVLADVEVDASQRVGALVGEHEGHIANVVVEAATVMGQEYVGGLVGRHQQGSIEASSVRDSTVEATGDDDAYVGGLVGRSRGDIDDSSSSGSVEGHDRKVGGLVGRLEEGATISDSGSSADVTGHADRVGGLVGDARDQSTSIVDSHATGDVTSHGGDAVGGLVGRLRADLTGSHATGDVEADGDYVGGLVGLLEDDHSCNVEDSWAGGVVESTGGSDSYGGLVGEIRDDCDVIDSRASGDVTAPEIEYVGGLIGYVDHNSTISETTARGDVVGETRVGGLVGRIDDGDGTVEDGHASGNVSGIDDQIGGLVGRLEGTVRRCSATGDVSSANDRIGGLVGRMRGDDPRVESSFATGQVTGHEEVGGLVGQLDDGVIRDSYAVGNALGDEYVGGLVGESEGDGEDIARTYSAGFVAGDDDVGGLIGSGGSEDSFWDVDTSGQSSSAGDETGLETLEFAVDGNFLPEWDLTEDPNELGNEDDFDWYLVSDETELEGMGGDEDNRRPRLMWEFN